MDSIIASRKSEVRLNFKKKSQWEIYKLWHKNWMRDLQTFPCHQQWRGLTNTIDWWIVNWSQMSFSMIFADEPGKLKLSFKLLPCSRIDRNMTSSRLTRSILINCIGINLSKKKLYRFINKRIDSGSEKVNKIVSTVLILKLSAV